MSLKSIVITKAARRRMARGLRREFHNMRWTPSVRRVLDRCVPAGRRAAYVEEATVRRLVADGYMQEGDK